MKRVGMRFWFVIGFALYVPLFFLPLPPSFESRGIEIVDEFLLIIACALIYVAFKRQGWVWKALGLTTVLIVMTVPLLRVWEKAESGNNLILGLLPFLDAGGYYSDALRLILGKMFESEGVYRPLFSVFLATLLKVINGNLQLAIAILMVIYALGIYSLAYEVRTGFGAIAGVAIIIFFQFFYRLFAGAPMTEQLGTPLGAFGLTALLQSVRTGNKYSYISGFFLTSLALIVRAGAYFIIPILILFGLFSFIADRKSSIVFAVLLFLAGLIPWGIDLGVRRLVTPPGSVPFINFAHTLYGQAKGGTGFVDIYFDHPELLRMPKYEIGRAAYKYVLDEIAKNPLGIVQGSGKALVNFMSPVYLFNVFQTRNPAVNLILQIISFLLFLAGLYFLWRRRHFPPYGLLLAGFLGMLISAPFLPPWDAGAWFGGIRVHAATIGFHLTITAIGLSELLQILRWPVGFVQEEATQNGQLVWVLGFVLALATMIGPVLLAATVQTFEPKPMVCADGEDLRNFILKPGSYIRVENNDSGMKTYVPVVLIKHVERSVSGLAFSEFAFVPRRINQKAIFTVTNDTFSGKRLWVIGPPELADFPDTMIAACGKTLVIRNFGYDIFYVSAFQE